MVHIKKKKDERQLGCLLDSVQARVSSLSFPRRFSLFPTAGWAGSGGSPPSSRQHPPHTPCGRCWGHSLELVDDDHSDMLAGLQDLLQPVDVVCVWVPERDVVGQARDLNGVWAVPDQFVRDQHGPVQAQGLA